MTTLFQDLRFALRQFVRRPGFTAIAVLSLALAIGGNSLIYGMLDGFVFRPFQYPDPDRLVAVGVTFPKLSSETTFVEALSPAEYVDIRSNRSFAHVGSFDLGNRNISGGDVPERVFTALLLDDLFPVLGMTPVLGRGFTREELGPNGPPAAIISHRLWQSRFGGDPGLVNRAIRVNGRATSVVGVMPPGLVLIGTDLWVPWGGDPLQVPRNVRQFNVLARLAPGASLDQANAELDTIARRVEQTEGARFAEYENFRLTAAPLAVALLRDVRPAAFVLLAAVGLVLLIACANLTNLFLARSSTRQRELAVRLALGAARWRLTRLLLTESLLLAIAGGAIGVVIAWAGLQGAEAIIPGQFRSLGLEARINPRVLMWSVALAVASGFLIGLVPALQATHTDPHESLKADTRTGGSRAARRLRHALVVGELAAVGAAAPGRGTPAAQLPQYPARRSRVRCRRRVDDEAHAAARQVSGRSGWSVLRSVVGTTGRASRCSRGLGILTVSSRGTVRHAVHARAAPAAGADASERAHHRGDAELSRSSPRATACGACAECGRSSRHAARGDGERGVCGALLPGLRSNRAAARDSDRRIACGRGRRSSASSRTTATAV